MPWTSRSWVVNAGTGEPTGYTDTSREYKARPKHPDLHRDRVILKHPDLHRDRVILKTGSELLALLKRCANP